MTLVMRIVIKMAVFIDNDSDDDGDNNGDDDDDDDGDATTSQISILWPLSLNALLPLHFSSAAATNKTRQD